MISWMVIYHVLLFAWSIEIAGLKITDPALIQANAHAYINANGKSEVLNPCLLFPYLSFFMPWFFYKSGQFFRKQPWNQLFHKDAKKLLLTYAVWSGIGYVLFVIKCLLDGTATLHGLTYSVIRRAFLTGSISCNGPLWFLMTLFGVHVIADFLLPNQTGDGKRTHFFHLKCGAVVLVGYIVSFLAYRFDYRLLPFWVANGAAGLAFYTIGYWLGNCEMHWWILSPCLVVYVLCCFNGFPMVDMLFNNLLNGSFLLWIPVAICGIIVFNELCRLVMTGIGYIQKKLYRNKQRQLVLEKIGVNAMPILVSHYLLLEVYGFIANHYEYHCWPHIVILFVVMVVLFTGIIWYNSYKKTHLIDNP